MQTLQLLQVYSWIGLPGGGTHTHTQAQDNEWPQGKPSSLTSLWSLVFSLFLLEFSASLLSPGVEGWRLQALVQFLLVVPAPFMTWNRSGQRRDTNDGESVRFTLSLLSYLEKTKSRKKGCVAACRKFDQDRRRDYRSMQFMTESTMCVHESLKTFCPTC